MITSNANGAREVHATDLDGDGDADVLSASREDDKIAWYENLSWKYRVTQASNGDVSFKLLYGQPLTPYFMFHSPDPLNGTSPGTGIIGLHISMADLMTQVTLGSQGNPLFGGTLDDGGASTLVVPGSLAALFSGQTWFGMGAQLTATGYAPTAVAGITFQ